MPPNVLTEIDKNTGLTPIEFIESIATSEDLEIHPELDGTVRSKKFFLIMTFDKK